MNDTSSTINEMYALAKYELLDWFSVRSACITFYQLSLRNPAFMRKDKTGRAYSPKREIDSVARDVFGFSLSLRDLPRLPLINQIVNRRMSRAGLARYSY